MRKFCKKFYFSFTHYLTLINISPSIRIQWFTLIPRWWCWRHSEKRLGESDVWSKLTLLHRTGAFSRRTVQEPQCKVTCWMTYPAGILWSQGEWDALGSSPHRPMKLRLCSQKPTWYLEKKQKRSSFFPVVPTLEEGTTLPSNHLVQS